MLIIILIPFIESQPPLTNKELLCILSTDSCLFELLVFRFHLITFLILRSECLHRSLQGFDRPRLGMKYHEVIPQKRKRLSQVHQQNPS